MLTAAVGTLLSAAVMFAVSLAVPSDPYGDGALRNIAVCAAVFAPGAAAYLTATAVNIRSKRRREEKKCRIRRAGDSYLSPRIRS